MGFGINGNDYGIDRKEWKQLKKELKTEAKQGNIDLTRTDIKDIKKAIKTGDLGAHLDQVGKDMQGVLGLHLTSKVDGTEAIANAQEVAEITAIVDNVKLENGVDTEKVLQYIRNANISRVQEHANSAISNITALNATNSLAYFDELWTHLHNEA